MFDPIKQEIKEIYKLIEELAPKIGDKKADLIFDLIYHGEEILKKGDGVKALMGGFMDFDVLYRSDNVPVDIQLRCRNVMEYLMTLKEKMTSPHLVYIKEGTPMP